MSFEVQLPVVTSLVPDSVYASGILSVKFKSLAGRVVFFRPFISRKSSNGLFVERVIAVFPNGELHLFDADARPKRGVNLSQVSSIVHEGSTVVLIFDGRSSEQEDLQLRFDNGPGELQRHSSAVAARVQIREPPSASNSANTTAGGSSPEQQVLRASLASPKQFVSVVCHYSPSVAKLYDVPIDDLELDLQKPANFVRPINMVETSAPLPVFSNKKIPADYENSRRNNNNDDDANTTSRRRDLTSTMNDDAASRSSVGLDGLHDAHHHLESEPSLGGGGGYDDRPLPEEPRRAFRDLAPQSESFTLDSIPEVANNLSVDELHTQNIVMFGELKGLLNGMEKAKASQPPPADDEEYHPQIHSTMSSVQYRQALADRLREHHNRESFMERQRSLSNAAADEGSPTRRGGGILDFERLFLGDAKAAQAASSGGPDQSSPERVLARLRAKHTELKVQNLMLQGELRGLGLVMKNAEQEHLDSPTTHHSSGGPGRDVVTLYRELEGERQQQMSGGAKLIATKKYQRAINLSVLVLNICRKRRQAVLQAVRQSRIEEERRTLEGQYFVSTGLPLSMMSK